MSWMTDVTGELRGALTDGLAIAAQYEQDRINRRFAELQLQAQLLETVSKTSNPQAGAGTAVQAPAGASFSAWVNQNPLLAAGLGIGAALLVYLAVK